MKTWTIGTSISCRFTQKCKWRGGGMWCLTSTTIAVSIIWSRSSDPFQSPSLSGISSKSDWDCNTCTFTRRATISSTPALFSTTNKETSSSIWSKQQLATAEKMTYLALTPSTGTLLSPCPLRRAGQTKMIFGPWGVLPYKCWLPIRYLVLLCTPTIDLLEVKESKQCWITSDNGTLPSLKQVRLMSLLLCQDQRWVFWRSVCRFLRRKGQTCKCYWSTSFFKGTDWYFTLSFHQYKK